jgi:hypothetical protein
LLRSLLAAPIFEPAMNGAFDHLVSLRR